jgi:hypothetical protein
MLVAYAALVAPARPEQSAGNAQIALFSGVNAI